MVQFTPDAPPSPGTGPGEAPAPSDDHDFVLINHANLIDDHTGALQAHGETLDAIITHLSGSPGGPWQWERLDKVQARKLWGELVAFVDFLDRRYLRYLGGQGARIVTDWYKHPVLVELFTALMVAYQHAYAQNSRVPSFALVEWHERCLWPTFDRIEQLRLLNGSTDQGEWAGPDALPTHDNHPERFEAFLAEDLEGREAPQPKPKPKSTTGETPAPARAARPAPTRSRSGDTPHLGDAILPDTSDGDFLVPAEDDAPPPEDAPPPPFEDR